MAKRPVYMPLDKRPYFKMEEVDFVWNPGLAPSQKKKNSKAIEKAFMEKHPEARVLEVSTKSDKPEGEALSPFNLTKQIPSLHKSFPVENVYQAAKVYEQGGPYVDLFGTTPLEAKRDERKETSGPLHHFQLEGKDYPAYPEILFYNWLYVQSLLEHPEAAKAIAEYDAFTDVEYSPASKTKNNQARACAIYKSLLENNLLDKAKDFDSFQKLFLEAPEYLEPVKPITPPSQPTVKKRTVFREGQWISHPGIGKGQILSKDAKGYLINFRVAGPRKIAKDFVELECSLL